MSLGCVGAGGVEWRWQWVAKTDTIAIMKAIGAGSGEIMRIYLIQTLMLGLLGAVLGIAFGTGVQLAFRTCWARCWTCDDRASADAHGADGARAGILTTLLFTLLRCSIYVGASCTHLPSRGGGERRSLCDSFLPQGDEKNFSQIIAVVLILQGFRAIATTLSDSVTGGSGVSRLVLLRCWLSYWQALRCAAGGVCDGFLRGRGFHCLRRFGMDWRICTGLESFGSVACCGWHGRDGRSWRYISSSRRLFRSCTSRARQTFERLHD